jgi:3-oxoacyl-[acyl-carrier protein] reductase
MGGRSPPSSIRSDDMCVRSARKCRLKRHFNRQESYRQTEGLSVAIGKENLAKYGISDSTGVMVLEGLLCGKVCLVTGAGRGIGRAIAVRFAKEGADVYANIRLESAVKGWVAGLPEDVRGAVTPVCFDVTDKDAVKNAVMRIRSEKGGIDVLVNNAAVAHNEKLGMISRQHVEEMFAVNVFAVIELTQMAARLMMRQKNGSIINISSIVGVKGDKGQAAYSASKGAVIAFTKSAAKELAPYGIRVNSVAPGLTDTDMFRKTDEKFLEERLKNIGMQRVGRPEDVADACLFLASDLSGYVSGQILGVDGCSVL